MIVLCYVIGMQDFFCMLLISTNLKST